MKTIEETIRAKEGQPKPAPTSCKRCGETAEPKHLAILGWRQQEYCDSCQKIISDAQREEAEKRGQAQRREELLKRSGIMRGLLGQMTFSTFDSSANPKGYEIASRYAESFRSETARGLMLHGKAGCGKTHLASAIARHLIERKLVPVTFVRVVDLLQEIRSTYDENEYRRTASESDLIRKYTTAPLLILDDLGSEKATDWARQVLYQIIDERWIEQKPIIVTSNLTLYELEIRLEERITSRIAGLCDTVEIAGKDHRLIRKGK